MDFDYTAARNAGYSDDQILDGLQKAGRLNFDLSAARKSGYSAADILESLYGRRAAAAEPATESSSLLRRAGDIGISAIKGAMSVPEAAIGLADIVTGGAAGRGAEALGLDFKRAREVYNDLYSPEQKAANQRVAEAKGFVDTAGAMLANPSTIVQTGVESLPAMVAGGGIGRGVLAMAPRVGAVGAAAIGEGAVGAGQQAEQIRQDSGGDLTLGQAGAALASGIGTGIFGAVGGRLAQKLGIGDIDTMLVRAGAPQQTSKGVARRLIEGAVSEGVFEELPQSIQEQIWQNAAMDKPLLEGVPENAAQGLIAGGLFGGIAGGALRGGREQATVGQNNEQGGETPLLGNSPDPFISFPDGSVGRQSDVDAFITSLPEDQRMAARARFMGYAPQDNAPATTPADVLAAGDVDEAINLAQQALDTPTPDMLAARDAQIDAAWSSFIRQRASERQAQFDLANQQRRDADVPAMESQLADQQVAQADALTRAQGFDEPAPTAMQLAMQAAQARRQAAIETATQRRITAAQENANATVTAPAAETAAVGTSDADVGAAVPVPAPAAGSVVAPAGASDSSAASPDAGTVRSSASGDVTTRARAILNAAGVTGNERMAALRAVRTGENTLEDLIDAHPPKEMTNATPPTDAPAVPGRYSAGDTASAPIQQAAAPGRETATQLADLGPGDTTAAGVPAAGDVRDGAGAATAASGELTGDEPLASRAATKQRLSIVDDVERAIAPSRAKWRGFSNVNVVQSAADLPPELADRVTADEGSEGYYDPRTRSVYLIADNIRDPQRAAFVAAHEVVGHGGLRMLNDKSVSDALKLAGANRFIRDLAAAIDRDRGASAVSIEEAIAELAAATETGDFDGLAERYGVQVPAAARGGVRGAVARVFEAVRRFLAEISGRPVADVSDAEVRGLIAQQQAAVAGGQSTDASEMGDTAPARASVTPASKRTIEVDGDRRPITDSTGKLVAQDFQKQQAFYRWFGDSKVVDEQGRPLVVYHGTPSGGFSSFDAERAGTNTGAAGGDHGLGGFYFTPDASIADTYSRSADVEMVNEYERLFGEPPKAMKAPNGSSIYPVYLSLKNPFITERGPISEAMVRDAKQRGHDGIISGKGSYPEYVAFEPEQIKSATGNAGTFDPENADIRASRAPSAAQTPPGEERIPKWAADLTPAQQAALRKSGAIYTEKTVKQKVKELTDGALKKLQYGILDQFAPIKDQLGKIPYIMARMAKNADGTLEALMLYGRPHLDADGGMLVDTTKKGFIETMQQLDGEHDRFFSWLAGRRAAQLKTEGRENLFTDDDISALATLNQGTMKDGRSREAAYLRAQKDVAELNKSVLDIAESSGLIDAESRRVWQSDFYVPFYRVMEEGVTGPSVKSGLVNQKSIKKLKGGTNSLNDLTKNMLMNWSTLLTASAKNRAAKASLDAAVGMGAASEAPEATIRAMAKSAQTKAVSYMESGTNRWFVVEDEHLLAAISALEFSGYNNGAMKVMSAFKNYLTRAITISPFFKVRNLIRDSLSVIAVSNAGYNPVANLRNGYSLLRKDDIKAQLIAGGAIYRFGTYMEGNRAENVKRLIDDGVPDDTILNTAEKMAKFTRKLYQSYENLGDMSENLNRAALYQKLRDEGKSHLEASFEARDLMDFGLSGAWAGVRALNQILPFFNARLQGLYKLGRGYNDDPKRMGYVVGTLALATIALAAAYKDDDDWKKRSDSDRANYWWFKVGGTAYRIPKPFEIGAAATAIDEFAALFYDSENTDAKRFGQQLGELVNGQLAMNPIPQVFRPVLDIYANKDAFTGRPIESLAMQRLKPEDRYTYNTSELARMLSKSGLFVDPLTLVSGAGVKQLSPVQIDALVKGYFAGVGVLAVSAVDGLLHHTVIDRGEALPVPLRTLTGSFMEELPTTSSRYVDMLYNTAQDVEQSYASYQNAIKSGDINKARQIMKDEGGTLAKYHMIESLKKNESRINQVIQRTRNSKELTGQQKEETIRRLKILQDQIARRMVTGK